MKYLTFPMSFALVTLVATSVSAVPLQLPVQGVLRDNAGVPVAEDVFGMTFALYDSPDAAEAVWTESWPPGDGDCQADPTDCVHVVSGTFQVMLGALEEPWGGG